MALLTLSSPHLLGANKTSKIMRWVILLTLPGLIAQTVYFGWGNVHNVLFCCAIALLSEAIILKLRKLPLAPYLGDGSALVTAVLLGLALPPFSPWWISVIATVFAIVFSKHLYGGMGYNPFNPAMAGYALVLVSFPVAMTTNWATPSVLLDSPASIGQTISAIWQVQTLPDAYTGATPLDVYKHEITFSTAAELRQNPVFGEHTALGWEWVNAGFLLGGLVLLALRIIPWHTPVFTLAGLALPSIILGWDADQSTPLSLHLFSGATMLGAFFIATDPVSSSTTKLGRCVYGFGIGLLTYIIRRYGGYPDAIAFAVLLMNFAVPLIDVYTQPRTYGFAGAKRGPKRKDPS